MAKKKEIYFGKGFKRIFYVIAAAWFIILMAMTAAERSECIGDPSITPPFCDDTTDVGAFSYSLLM